MREQVIAILLMLSFIMGMSNNAAVPLQVSSQTQGFLSVKGAWIVDPLGRPVILRGVNYPGYQAGGVDPILHTQSAYEKFSQFGFNVVRLPISWGNLEPSPGSFNEYYLAQYVDSDVRWAKKNGLYIVLDMHQVKWATRFGGNGVPDWTVANYPPTEVGMRQALTDFWNQSELQDHFVEVWRKVALRYANESAIAGYDILNEPWIYTSIATLNATHVNNLYVKVIKAIRSADTNHMIVLEPSNLLTYEFPLKEDIVWSPHFYTLSYATRYFKSNASVLEADIAAKYQKFVVEMGSPMWIGEFGAFMKDSSSGNWLQDAITAFNKFQVGWAWWAFYGTIPNVLFRTPIDQATMTSKVNQTTISSVFPSAAATGDIVGSARNEEISLSSVVLVVIVSVVALMIFSFMIRRGRLAR